MNEADALDIMQYAVWTVLVASAPVVLVAMVVGIGIALVQALTQIQEITLTFVPKIVAIMLVVALSGPFVGSQISAFANVIFERLLEPFRERRESSFAFGSLVRTLCASSLSGTGPRVARLDTAARRAHVRNILLRNDLRPIYSSMGNPDFEKVRLTAEHNE
jgi:flagellar biosynthetic protein FliQ